MQWDCTSTEHSARCVLYVKISMRSRRQLKKILRNVMQLLDVVYLINFPKQFHKQKIVETRKVLNEMKVLVFLDTQGKDCSELMLFKFSALQSLDLHHQLIYMSICSLYMHAYV